MKRSDMKQHEWKALDRYRYMDDESMLCSFEQGRKAHNYNIVEIGPNRPKFLHIRLIIPLVSTAFSTWTGYSRAVLTISILSRECSIAKSIHA